MEWTEIKIYTTTEGIEPLSAALLEAGISGIQIEDDNEIKRFIKESSIYWDYVDEEILNKPAEDTKIKVYVSDNPYGDEMLANIKDAVNRLRESDIGIDLGTLDIEINKNMNDEVWLNKWKEYYKPFNVGNKITVKPIWEEIRDNEGRIILNINPGNAFGTGLHQTTQLCMAEIEKYVNNETVIADLGCGSGILSIAAILLGAEKAAAVDIDENAVKSAYENAALNGIGKDKYFASAGNIINDKKLQDKIGYDRYDIVAANIIADVICAVSPVVSKILKSQGIFIAGGIIKERIDDVKSALAENGFEIIGINTKDEWVSITSRAGEKFA